MTMREYVGLFRRRWWVVALFTVLCLAISVVLSASETPMYRSSATVLINQNNSSAIFDPVSGSPFSYAERLAENEARFLQSELVEWRIMRRWGICFRSTQA